MKGSAPEILDQLTCGIQIVDANWTTVYANDRAIEHSRQPREAIVGQNILERNCPDAYRHFYDLLKECRATQSDRKFEFEHTHEHTESNWFDFHFKPFQDGILIISKEIHDRKHIEKELMIAKEKAEEREQNIVSIYNTVGNIIFKLAVEPGEQYRFESVNHRFLEVTGLSEEAIIGQLVNDIIPEPSLSMVLENYRTAIRENKIVRWEEVSTYPTGELTGEVSIAPNYNAEGVCKFLVGAVHDITQRKKNEKLLEDQNRELIAAKERAENNEAKIIAFTDQSPISIFTMDTGGLLSYANKKWLETAGMELEEALGEGWLKALHEDDRERIKLEWQKRIGSNTGWTYECRIVDKQGRITWVEGAVNGLRDTRNNLVGYTGTNFDITDRKLAEKAIMENQRIKVVGEMTSAIAHDFNNALQSILGNLELVLLRGDCSEKSEQNLESARSIVMDAAQRAQLVQRFGGHNQNNEHFQHVEINALFEKLISNSKHLWKDKVEQDGISIEIETRFADIPELYCVEGEISAVLLNLIKNSIEAMPQGGTLSIETRNVPEGVCILIADTGIGMDEETRARIFQPFFTTKGFDVGRGLGMSGAYGIIKEHGGKIAVRFSEPNKGTVIEIVLPLREEHGE